MFSGWHRRTLTPYPGGIHNPGVSVEQIHIDLLRVPAPDLPQLLRSVPSVASSSFASQPSW